MSLHVHLEDGFNPFAYSLACWLASEKADFSDIEDCKRVIYRSASSLCRFGFTVSEAERFVYDAAAFARENPEVL